MEKATVTFEVTKDKTIVIATGIKGNVDKLDITGTEMENKLIVLLKDLHEYQETNEILEAINTDNWKEV